MHIIQHFLLITGQFIILQDVGKNTLGSPNCILEYFSLKHVSHPYLYGYFILNQVKYSFKDPHFFPLNNQDSIDLDTYFVYLIL